MGWEALNLEIEAFDRLRTGSKIQLIELQYQLWLIEGCKSRSLFKEKDE